MGRSKVYHRKSLSVLFFVFKPNNQVNRHGKADLGQKFKMWFLWPEISHSSLSHTSCCNNESSSWNPSSVAITPRHLENTTVNLLISFYLNPELINSHSGRLCCCSASPSRETNQTMGVIERRNRWHYWILITSFPRRRRTQQLPGYKIRVCVRMFKCVYRRLERKADDWLIRFSQRLKEGRKWLSAHPTLSGWIPPVAAWRAPSIWRGA